MNVAVISGSAGLVGSEAVAFFSRKFDLVLGFDNDRRRYFFGPDATTFRTRFRLENEIQNYRHFDADIRDLEELKRIFQKFGSDIRLILHTAAQPSHDWAAREPFEDFTINANGTLNLLELTRQCCPEAVFIFTSTNKVYGDRPNSLPLEEKETRWEIDPSHPYFLHGIDETMPVDQSKHSLFGASKLAADILVQEYGRYFGMKTGVFRGGCLTGPQHNGSQLHGFLSYLMKCAVTGKPYRVFGYKGKQVRDNIHSYDLVNMFWCYYCNPRIGEVYNVGGGRYCSCSVVEAIDICERITGNKMNWTYDENHRNGDHIWWISNVSKFKAHYPNWDYTLDLQSILKQIHFEIYKNFDYMANA